MRYTVKKFQKSYDLLFANIVLIVPILNFDDICNFFYIQLFAFIFHKLRKNMFWQHSYSVYQNTTGVPNERVGGNFLKF